jgi:hypothetical protein
MCLGFFVQQLQYLLVLHLGKITIICKIVALKGWQQRDTFSKNVIFLL